MIMDALVLIMICILCLLLIIFVSAYYFRCFICLYRCYSVYNINLYFCPKTEKKKIYFRNNYNKKSKWRYTIRNNVCLIYKYASWIRSK